jgi:hypothetical protein
MRLGMVFFWHGIGVKRKQRQPAMPVSLSAVVREDA